MAKERLVEQYGELRYTIGTGCSGGSLAQQQVANAYPGIYQGILPQCSFPDAWSTGQQLADYHLIRALLREPGEVGHRRGLGPGLDRRGRGPPQPRQLDRLRHGLLDRRSACRTTAAPGVPADRATTTPQTNPGGVRCTLADYMINVFGPRPSSVWSRARASRSATASPACRSTTSACSTGSRRSRRARSRPAQFVDLNAKIGGGDIDINPTAERIEADRAGARATPTAAAAINSDQQPRQGRDHRPARARPGRVPRRLPLVGDPRAARARAGALPANHVIWFGAAPLIGDPNYDDRGPARDGPLARRGRGRQRARARSRRRSSDDRPSDVHDRCSQVDGVEQVDVPGVGPVCELDAGPDALRHAARRSPARASRPTPTSASSSRCGAATTTRSRSPTTSGRSCRKAFPTGVCDWSKPGVDQQGTIPWQTYQDPAAAWSTAGGRSAPRPAARATAGPARHLRDGAAADLRARPGGVRITHRRCAGRAVLRPCLRGAELLEDPGAPDDLQHARVPGAARARSASRTGRRRTAMQAADPERNFTGHLCASGEDGCAGDVRLYDWQAKGYGIVQPVLFTARNGATISGHVWATTAGPAKRPGHRDHQRLGPGRRAAVLVRRADARQGRLRRADVRPAGPGPVATRSARRPTRTRASRRRPTAARSSTAPRTRSTSSSRRRSSPYEPRAELRHRHEPRAPSRTAASPAGLNAAYNPFWQLLEPEPRSGSPGTPTAPPASPTSASGTRA